ncbi:hypothetical protein [Clostridium perfringens]|uniref:hypothetical protein n=1 Tax=Clostridium perfringens TaxID=1502 RepID=UPI0024BCAF14|nr:hypothetical protein [Clostridium perfringens]
MDKELVIDILQRRYGLESALNNFMIDIRENQDKKKYYHFIVDDEKIYYYSDYNKKINNTGIEIITGKWINDFKRKTKVKEEEYLKNNFVEIFYYDVNYINLLKRKINALLKVLYNQSKSIA